jgi:hypothetical protein
VFWLGCMTNSQEGHTMSFSRWRKLNALKSKWAMIRAKAPWQGKDIEIVFQDSRLQKNLGFVTKY